MSPFRIALLGMGLCALASCRKPQVKKAPPPKSDAPIIKLRSHKGVHLKYDILNTSGGTFQGLVVVVDGSKCEGPRSRRLLLKYSSPPLAPNTARPIDHKMPFFCQKVKLKAFDVPRFKRTLKKHHHPFVRFSRAGRIVRYEVQNRSIIPFRGLAVLLVGTQCEGPRPTRYWLGGTRYWLYPGYKRSFAQKLDTDCLNVRVSAQDLVSFIEKRRAYIKAQRAQQQKIRQAAQKLLKGL